MPPTNWLVARALLERIGPWREPTSIGWPVDLDILFRITASEARIACAPRLTTIKFPSPLWRAYAADAPRPQIAMSQELARDAGTLAARLLCEVAAEHARATVADLGAAAGAALARRGAAREGGAGRDAAAVRSTRRSSARSCAGGTSASAAAPGSSAVLDARLSVISTRLVRLVR